MEVFLQFVGASGMGAAASENWWCWTCKLTLIPVRQHCSDQTQQILAINSVVNKVRCGSVYAKCVLRAGIEISKCLYILVYKISIRRRRGEGEG